MKKEFEEEYPGYEVTKTGKIYKYGKPAKLSKSGGYDQVILINKNHEYKNIGVHTAVAMNYIDGFFEGCIVHHKDGNKRNNNVENLEIMSRSDHVKLHMKEDENRRNFLGNYNKLHGVWNKNKSVKEKYKESFKQGINTRKRNKAIKEGKVICPLTFDD